MYDAIAIIAERQASGTNGGTFTSGARRTRTLNTEIYDPDGIVSISANQFTLQAGRYIVEAYAPSLKVNSVKAWLYNVTDAADVEFSDTRYATAAYNSGVDNAIWVDVTIAGAKAFEIQHRCATTQTTSGMGNAHSWGTEQYTTVVIKRVAAASNHSWACVTRNETLGTDGGGSTSGSWATMTLNTEVFDADAIVSLSSNQFTLGAGTYEVLGVMQFYNSGISQLRIYDATNTTEIDVGMNASEVNLAGSIGSCIGKVFTVLTPSASTAYELQARVTTTQATTGLGVGCDFDTEQYGTVYIRKIA